MQIRVEIHYIPYVHGMWHVCPEVSILHFEIYGICINIYPE